MHGNVNEIWRKTVFLGTTLLIPVECRKERTIRYPPKKSNASINYLH